MACYLKGKLAYRSDLHWFTCLCIKRLTLTLHQGKGAIQQIVMKTTTDFELSGNGITGVNGLHYSRQKNTFHATSVPFLFLLMEVKKMFNYKNKM